MKLKKIITSVITSFLALSLFAPLASAYNPIFNNHPEDNPLIRIKNVTKGETEYKTSTTANIGDTLRFVFWVHNTVEQTTAENVKVRAELPTNYSVNHTIKGYITASNADTVSGSTSVSLSESGKLEYQSGKTIVYSNVFGDGLRWPNDNIVTNGIELGSVQGCWDYVVQISFEAKVVAEPEEGEPHLIINKQVSYGDERNNGRWYDSIAKDKKLFGPGEYLYYHINLENTGDKTVEDVTIEDKLPPYINWTSGAGKYDSGSDIVTIEVGDIAPHAKITVEYQVRVEETLPNGDRTQENVALVESENFRDLQDSTVVWINGPDVVTTVVEEKKEVVTKLPETGAHFLLINVIMSIGSLVTGLGFKKLESSLS